MHSQTGHVLVFDSGVGGLSIVGHIRSLLPAVRLTYLADSAYFPYGTLSEQQLLERVLGLLRHACQALRPQIIVLACNSASTIALPQLRQHLQTPIVGVVPAIKPAAQLSQSKVIGLLATPATINRRYTDDLIAEFAPQCQVLRLGSAELVALSERQATDIDDYRRILQPLFAHPHWQTLDTMVLACTHFPLVQPQLAAAAPSVRHWIDSGAAIARRVQHLLAEQPGGDGPDRDQALFTGDGNPSAQLSALLHDYGFQQVRQF